MEIWYIKLIWSFYSKNRFGYRRKTILGFSIQTLIFCIKPFLLRWTKFNFWWSTWVGNSTICIPGDFRVGNLKMEPVFCYSLNLTTCCDVILPYFGHRGVLGSKFNSWWCIWVRNSKIGIPANFRVRNPKIEPVFVYFFKFWPPAVMSYYLTWT